MEDSCDPLIRIGFIHEFSSLIIKFIGFEKVNVFVKLFERIKIKNARLFQTYLQYIILKGLLFALRTLKGHFFALFTGENFHNCFVVYGSCFIFFYGQHHQIV